MTGLRATFNLGNTSRSGRSWPRASPPARFPLGCDGGGACAVSHAFQRPALDPEPLPHLYDAADQPGTGAFPFASMRTCGTSRCVSRNLPPRPRLSQSIPPLCTGPLGRWRRITRATAAPLRLRATWLGSGTISGDAKTALGSLLEITQGGASTLELPSGECGNSLEDGDFCERPGFVRIGFGECRATVLPAGGTSDAG